MGQLQEALFLLDALPTTLPPRHLRRRNGSGLVGTLRFFGAML